MEHRIIRMRGRVWLAASPAFSPAGKTVAYGVLINRIQTAFHVAQSLGATLAFIAPRQAVNTALFEITGSSVPTVSPQSVQGRAIKACWVLAAPFRTVGPLAWVRHQAGRVSRAGARRLAALASRREGPARRRLKAAAATLERWGVQRFAPLGLRAQREWAERVRDAGKIVRKAERRQGVAPPTLGLPDRVASAARRDAQRLGVAVDREIVCLHVREAGYRKATDRPDEDRRNADIRAYFPAIDWVVAQGATVIRLGDQTMAPVARPGVVDLATSPQRTDDLELWLVTRCRLFVASDSGPAYLPRLFDIPCLTVNAIQFLSYARRVNDRFICKLVVDRAADRRLSVQEMLQPDYMTSALDAGRWAYEDNAPEDILAAVQESWRVFAGEAVTSPAQAAFDARRDQLVARRNDLAIDERRGLLVSQGKGSIVAAFADRYWSRVPVETVS